jgi:sugar lactone lactonase YvrE
LQNRSFAMKNLPALVLLALALPFTARAASLQTDQPADVVLGQPDFTTGVPVAGQPNRFNLSSSVARDPSTGKVFVADTGNNRILRFSSAAAAQSGSNPEAVFGQANFTNGSVNEGGSAAANTLSGPADVFVDAGGRLWVADAGNNRVLRFDLASQLSNNAPAGYVFGQPDFSTVTASTTQSTMSGPRGVFVDASSRLWVADSGNNRVLRFDNVTSKASGAPADGVLGQLTFLTSGAAAAALGMSLPASVTEDSAGNLWVADANNNRVLRFNSAASKLDGAAADSVLGQPDFATITSGLSATKMNLPSGVLLDTATGNLWVGDSGNHRAIRFTSAATQAIGAAANLVLGQPDFTTSTLATTARGGGGIVHIADGPNGSLLVADRDNSRVLRYSPIPVPTPKPPIISLIGATKRSTHASKLIIRGLSGDADGTVVVVKGNVNGGHARNARGISPWSFTARHLVAGRNRVRIRAFDNDGLRSSFVRLVITRK